MLQKKDVYVKQIKMHGVVIQLLLIGLIKYIYLILKLKTLN